MNTEQNSVYEELDDIANTVQPLFDNLLINTVAVLAIGLCLIPIVLILLLILVFFIP